MTSEWYDDPEELLDVARGRGRRRGGALNLPNYEDIREIGRGGQGIVYMARQISTNQRRAIKVLHQDAFDSPRAKRRFKRETEILASLQHPGIVRVHDRGETEDGRIYLILEYIEGRPLNELIKVGPPKTQKRLRESLSFFCKICEAVDYAHKRGVVHRDIKPNNIRVDLQGNPHVLDFGLAKNLETTDDSQSSTEKGGLFGAIPWASPEQAGGFREGVDIRTDVYSLGVILYQMMTSVFPYEVIGSIRDVLDNIIDAEPVKPLEHNPLVKGDLQTIILKTLAKEPDRRYQTAADLAKDIQHLLNDEPIEAKTDDTLYLVRKKLRRHKWPVAMAVVVMLLIIASSAVGWKFYLQASAARDEAHEVNEYLNKQRYFDLIGMATQDFKNNRISTMRARLAECPSDFRGWEWNYLNTISNTSIHTLRGHQSDVDALVFSDDETMLASTSSDGVVCLWDVATGNLLHPPFVADAVSGLAMTFSADGRQLYVAVTSGALQVWDTKAGQLENTIKLDRGWIRSVKYDARSDRLIAGLITGMVAVIDPESGKILKEVRTGLDDVRSVSLVRGSQRVIYGGIRGWGVVDLESGENIFTIESLGGGRDPVYAESANDRVLIGYEDGAQHLMLCDLETGACIGERWHPLAKTRGLACDSTGRWGVSCDDEGLIQVWDLTEPNADPYILRGHDQGVEGVVFSPSGRLIASAGFDQTVRIWQHPIAYGARDDNDAPVFMIREYIPSQGTVAVAEDGRFATASMAFLRMWDSSTGKLLAQRRMKAVNYVAFIPRSDTLVAVCSLGDAPMDPGRASLHVMKRDTLQTIWSSDILPFAATSVCVSRSGERITVAFAGSLLRDKNDSWIGTWDAKTGRLLRRIETGSDGRHCVCYDPAGGRFISTGFDGRLHVHDVAGGCEVRVIKAHEGDAYACTFSPDGQWIATAGQDGECIIRDAETGTEKCTLRRHNGAVYTIAFSSDGRRVISGGADAQVHVWDTDTGNLVGTLSGHQKRLCTVAFLPQDAGVISAGMDEHILIWQSHPLSQEALRQRYDNAASWDLFRRLAETSDYEPNYVQTMVRQVADMYPHDSELQNAFEYNASILSRAPWILEKRSWAIAERHDDSQANYERAVRIAQRAVEIAPEDLVVRQTLGVALCRAGQYEAGIEVLQPIANDRKEPHDFAFLAMCRYKLGNTEQAKADLARARELVIKPEHERHAHLHRFVDEAARLIEGGGLADAELQE